MALEETQTRLDAEAAAHADHVDMNDREVPPLDSYADEPGPHQTNGGGSSSNATVEPFPVALLNELTSAPPAGVVQGLGLDEGAVAAIVGVPNAGKTAFAVSLALAVASRSDQWLGRKVRGGPVVYFASEAPGSVTMRARAAASRQLAQLKSALYLSKAVPALGGEYTSSTDTDRMVATVRGVEVTEGEPVKMVFIDTLASCLGDGDENGAGMLRLVDAAKFIVAQTGTCVVLVHHPSKGDAASLRGHGSLAAACDAILRIEVDELTGVRTATLTKARDDATGLQLRFELEKVILDERDSFGDPRSTIVVKGSTQIASRPRPKGKQQMKLLEELERRWRTGETTWDEATVREAARGIGMAKSTAQDALKGLLTAGYLAGSSSHLTLKFPPMDGTK